jgi:DNA-binding HxlR family transcriptional regulator
MCSAEVATTTVGRAADVVDYFKSHARKVYRHLGRQRRSLVLRVLHALKQRGETAQHVLTREVFQRNVAAEHIRAALAELEEAGLVAQRVEDTAGRRVTLWRPL